ncbi:MAG: DUF4831 family protein [Bacteroidota bacterium]
MKIKNALFLSILSMSLWQCTSYKAIHLNSSNQNLVNTGLVYTLPQTALIANITVEKETKIKGPFAEYAEKLLGLKNVIAFNQTSYKISNIKISAIDIPDTAHQYLISQKGCSLFRRSSRFHLNGLGTIDQINSRSRRKLDSTLSSARLSITPPTASYPNFFKLYADASQIEKIDTVYETVKMDTIVMSRPIIKRTLVTKTVQQRAEEAADYILKFRLKRYELISATQEIPYSKDAFEFMNTQLIKMENDYLELFTGITQSESQQIDMMVCPSNTSQNKSIPLFGFSEDKGITEISEKNIEQYSLLLKTNNIIKKDSIIAKPKELIPYRNPEMTTIYIQNNGLNLPQFFLLPVHQYGILRYFPKGIKSFISNNNCGIISDVRIK